MFYKALNTSLLSINVAEKRFSDVFRGRRKGALGINSLIIRIVSISLFFKCFFLSCRNSSRIPESIELKRNSDTMWTLDIFKTNVSHK